ncbi:hypothetical protein [Paenibacillus wenxiniae]|uniref:Uncharacterized protein n=1 Tax=Paenibacillus wenxiniae TaxID=1636843 RepID=A0ABW4RNE2_9BACL
MAEQKCVEQAIKTYWIIGLLSVLASGLIIGYLQFFFNEIEAVAQTLCNHISMPAGDLSIIVRNDDQPWSEYKALVRGSQTYIMDGGMMSCI